MAHLIETWIPFLEYYVHYAGMIIWKHKDADQYYFANEPVIIPVVSSNKGKLIYVTK